MLHLAVLDDARRELDEALAPTDGPNGEGRS